MKIKFDDILKKLQLVPFFSDLDEGFLSELVFSAKLRVVRKNGLICQEGEYEETSFVILSGSVRVLVKNKDGINKQVCILGFGEIFGEIATMYGKKRTATIISDEDSEILYLDKKIMFALMDNSRKIKDFIHKRYRERSLKTELEKIELFKDLPDQFFKKLYQHVDIINYQTNETVFSFGDEARDFYIIIYGFAKILIPFSDKKRIPNDEETQSTSQSENQSENYPLKIVAFLSPGHYFGEMGLIEKGKRTATVVALTRLELIKIDRFTFHSIYNTHIDVRNRMNKTVENRKRANIKSAEDESYGKLMDWVVSSNIVQTDAVLLIDLNKCIKCETCVDTCERLFGTSRLSFNGLKFKNILIPTSCRHCQEPYCLVGCPTGAISRDFSGEVYHKSFCIGCGKCAKQCPYGNITIINRKQKRYKPFFNKVNTLFFRTHSKDKQRGISVETLDRRQRDNSKTHESTEKRKGGILKLAPKQYKNKNRNPSLKIAIKCDNCKEFPSMGCVQNCPRGAAQRINSREYFKELMPV